MVREMQQVWCFPDYISVCAVLLHGIVANVRKCGYCFLYGGKGLETSNVKITLKETFWVCLMFCVHLYKWL